MVMYTQRDAVEFYEGRFNDTEPDPLEGLSGMRRFLYERYRAFAQSHSRHRFIERMMSRSRGATSRKPMILDAGCGGGSRVIAKMGCVIGVDLSIQGARNAAALAGYDGAVVADVASLPFVGSSFDYVISRDLIGHLPEAAKESFFEEMKRVGRRGGSLIHAVEVESNNLLIRWARKYPQLYRESFVLRDGHMGLESPTAVSDRFRRHGLRLVEAKPLFRTGVVRPDSYLHFFTDYRQKSVLMDWVVRLAECAERHTILRGGWAFMAGLVDSTAGRFLPFDYAGLLLVCFENTKHDVGQP